MTNAALPNVLLVDDSRVNWLQVRDALDGLDLRLMMAAAGEEAVRKHLEEQLRQAQKLEAVGQLAGGIAHDFKNLLTITGYSELLLASPTSADQQRDYLREIHRAGERAGSLRRQLLAFSLGLDTVHGIVNQSGGTIQVSSEPGGGTTFKVYLPRCDDGKSSPSLMPRGTETILVAEDDEAVGGIVRVTLESLGYTMLAARHGNQAVELCRQHHGRIDLLMTDVVMPKMSNCQLADVILFARPATKVTCPATPAMPWCATACWKRTWHSCRSLSPPLPWPAKSATSSTAGRRGAATAWNRVNAPGSRAARGGVKEITLSLSCPSPAQGGMPMRKVAHVSTLPVGQIRFTGDRHNQRHHAHVLGRDVALTSSELLVFVRLLIARGTTRSGFVELSAVLVHRTRRALDPPAAADQQGSLIETGRGHEYRLRIAPTELRRRVLLEPAFFELEELGVITREQTRRLRRLCRVVKSR